MVEYLKVKNWARFQHYKDRNPPWIKLATDTFQNYEFSRLQDASKLLAICIWTLAARSKDGTVPDDFAWIKQQGGLTTKINNSHLNELITQGFIERASKALANRKQSASLETEGEGETEVEKKKNSRAPSKKKQATRLTIEFDLPEHWRQWTLNTCPGLKPATVAEEFRDYWIAQPGQKGVKLDWFATWRNWCRRQLRGYAK